MTFRTWNTASLVLLSCTITVLTQSLLPAAQTEKVARIEHGGDFRPRLPLLVSNFAQVELPVLVEAEAVATQIFAKAGVEAIWTNCPDHQECGGEKKGPEFRIRILSQGKGIVTHDRWDSPSLATKAPILAGSIFSMHLSMTSPRGIMSDQVMSWDR